MKSVFFTNANIGWAVGENGIILNTIDGGTNWSEQISGSGTSYDLNSVYFINDHIGWVVGNGSYLLLQQSKILKTIDGGKNWTEQNSMTNYSLYSVYFINENIGWAVGQGVFFPTLAEARILKTTDAGKTWNRQNSDTFDDLFSVFFSDANNGWAVGEYGVILKTNDGGDNWWFQKSGTSNTLKSVYFNDPATGWVVGGGGAIIKTIDSGGPFTAVEVFSDEKKGEQSPSDFELYQNYPNPFNSSTTISFKIPWLSEVNLKIFNLLGEEIVTLVNEKVTAGQYKIYWRPVGLPSGIYIYSLKVEEFNYTKKLIYAK